MAKLPQGWVVAALADVVLINPKHPPETGLNTMVSFVPMQAVSESSWKFLRTEERRYSEVRKGYTHFADGDVLLAKITPCFENGKAAIARGLRNGLGCGTTELQVLRPLNGLKAEYLYHYLHQESFRHGAIPSMTGSAGQLRVPMSYVQQVRLPIPPPSEQGRIVAKLEDLLNEVDACKERLKSAPLALKRFRRSVLAAACSGRLTESWRSRRSLPDWEFGPLGERKISVQTGPFGSALHKSDYVPRGVPIVNPMHIRDGKILANGTQTVSSNKAAELANYRLLVGDVVIGRRGEMGRVAVVQETGYICGTGSAFIRCLDNEIVPEFLGLCLRSPQTVAFLTESSVGTTMINLNQRIIGEIEFPKASPEEQKQVVRVVHALFKAADAIESRYDATKTSVDQLAQSILAKAFRGELVSQDPKDVPADKILERTRAASARPVTFQRS